MWRDVNWLKTKYGVTRITIGNWIRAGKFARVQRTEGGHYRVWVKEELPKYGYCRVETTAQKSELAAQARAIRKQHPRIQILKDIGSACDFKRPGFQTILEYCLSGSPIDVVVTNGDRLATVGLTIIEELIRRAGGRVIKLEENTSDERFDPAALAGFVTDFLTTYCRERSDSREKNKGLPAQTRAVV